MLHREDTIGINPPSELSPSDRASKTGQLRRRLGRRRKLDKKDLLKLAVRQASL